MSREQFLQMVSYDPVLDPGLNEAIEIWDAELCQLQQPQIHQIQQHVQQHPLIQQQSQVQQPAQEQQQIPIPEDLNSDSHSDSDSEWYDPMDVVFGIKRNITPQILHGLTRDPIIYEHNRSNFSREQYVKM